MTHPNVVRIHDLGEIDGIKYITMPYIEGQDLAHILAESTTLPVPRVLNIARQVASGLCAAHEAGVVHRDLKPANIMIEADDRALIMDFGIARSAGEAFEAAGAGTKLSTLKDASETRTGVIVGTLEYMAPEQARGERVDDRVDIYSLGMILYRMIVGRRLADRATDAYTDLLARMQAEPTRVREIDPTVPEAVDQIVSRCLQPDPALRYQSTPDLLAALERLDENGVPLPEPTPIWRSWRFWSSAAIAHGRARWRNLVVRSVVRADGAGRARSGVGADRRLHERDGRPTVQGRPRAVARRGRGRCVVRHRLRSAERASRRLTAQCRQRARRESRARRGAT